MTHGNRYLAALMKAFLLVLTLTLPVLGRAADAVLTIETPWVFAVPPGAKDTAAFLTFVNTGSVPVRVTGGRTEAAKRLAPMITTKEEGRLGMKDVTYLEVPAGGRLTLAPGGDHLMLYGLKAPLTVGQKIPLVLKLEPGGTLTVEAVVAKREPK
jgi:copper(I)-binding protein